MSKNVITVDFLHGLVPETELGAMIWQGENTSYPAQKLLAEQQVMADLIDKNYQIRLLRPQLALNETTAVEDIGNRLRLVIEVTAVTVTTNTVTVLGTNDEITDEDAEYFDALEVAITATGAAQYTGLLTSAYKNYMTEHTGAVTYTSYLVEPNYDFLYAYYWLYLIFRDARSQEGDPYDLKSKDFLKSYEERLNALRPFYDMDEDGEITPGEQNYNSIMYITR